MIETPADDPSIGIHDVSTIAHITSSELISNQQLVKNCHLKKQCLNREFRPKSPCGLELYCNNFYENYREWPYGDGHYLEGPPHFGAPKPAYECTSVSNTLEGISPESLEELYADIEDCRVKKQAWNFNNLCWRDTPRGDSVVCRCTMVCDMCQNRMNEWKKHHPESDKKSHKSPINRQTEYDRTNYIKRMTREDINEQKRELQFKF